MYMIKNNQRDEQVSKKCKALEFKIVFNTKHFFRDQHLRGACFVSIWTLSVWGRARVLFMGLFSRFIVSFTTSRLGLFFCLFF